MSRQTEDIMNEINGILNKKYRNHKDPLKLGNELAPVSFLTTGLLGYDYVNGGGGPIGFIEQIAGKASSGKTSLSLSRIAVAQTLGLTCALVDIEHTFISGWAETLGVEVDDLILYTPEVGETGEKILEVVKSMLACKEISLIIVDSVTAITPRAILEGTLEDKHYAGNSALLTQFLNQIIPTGLLADSGACLVLINQPRDVIGSRIPREKLPGGRALSHYSSIINYISRGDFIFDKQLIDGKSTEVKIGLEVKILNWKNKIRTPFKDQTLQLLFDQGFNPLLDVLLFGRRCGLIERKGSWSYYKGDNMGQGPDNQMQWLLDHLDVFYALKEEARGMILSGNL